jgi:hypothetical protein
MPPRASWVRVGEHRAFIGYTRKHASPTFIVLAPKAHPRHAAPVVCAGTCQVLETGDVSLVVLDGTLPAELEPALIEVARNLVWCESEARP